MSRRSLSIIALLVVAFAASALYGKQRPPVAQYGGGYICGNGACEPGEGYILCPEDCPTQCGDGYCDNYEVQQGSQYHCPADCEVCANGGEWPSCCPEGRSGPYCLCDNGSGNPDCSEEDPCSQPDAYETNPDCNDCLKGSCSAEDKCNDSCRGKNERCEGVGPSSQFNAEEQAQCSCASYPDADAACKTIGLGKCKNDDSSVGPCCNGACKLTQCSDSKDNEEQSPYSGRTFQDDKADKEDWACKECESCYLAGENSPYDASKDSEYDECHDPDAPAKQFQTIPGSPVSVAQSGESFLSRFLAQFSPPPDDDKKVSFCADQGALALNLYDPVNKVYRFANGQNDQCVQCAQAPTVACFNDTDLQNKLKKIDDDCDKMKRNAANARNVKAEKDPVAKAQRIAGLEAAINTKCQELKDKATQDAQIAGRAKATNWCQVQCADPEVWKAEKMEFANGVVPDELQNLCRAQCFCGCAPVQDPPNEANALKIKLRSDDPINKPIDSVTQCIARCYHDVDWKAANAKNIDACRADCMGMFCAAPDPVNKQGTTGGTGGSGGGSAVCYGQFSNGCQYDLCEIMSWYGQNCGFNPPQLPNIAGGAGGGGGAGGPGGTGGTASEGVPTTAGGGPGGGGGSSGGNPGGGGSSVSSRTSSAGSSRSSGGSSLSASRSASSASTSRNSSATSASRGSSTSRSSVPLFTRSSSRSSFRFSAVSSYLQVLACPPDACSVNDNAGNRFCGQQGMACVSANGIPCIRCVEGEFSSASYGSVSFGASSFPSSTSSRPVSCGNGRLDAGEECDDGNASNFDSCTTACKAVTASSRSSSVFSASSRDLFALRFCGNGSLNEGEQCDLGADNSDLPNASCRTDCSLSRCGDQIVDGIRGEECDDGNGTAGDGCSASCSIEQFAGNPSSSAVLPGSLIELPFSPGSPNKVIPTAPGGGPIGDTGPETVAIMAAGASAGYTWMRMRKKK